MIARGGGRVERAQVGDPLELHFTILDLEVLFIPFSRIGFDCFHLQSPYEIFVRELIAKVLEICVIFC